MTSPDHMARVRKMAERFVEQTPDACPIDRPCSCPTCGVVTLLVRGRLRNRGWSEEAALRVAVRPYDFRGGTFHVASLRVDDVEVYRIERRPDEALSEDVTADIESALRRNPE